ncbi:hypothetical protein K435DRAFT_691979, partial [Dendrothele bispora CBS 962.96]
PIVERKGRVIGLLGGQPRAPNWKKLIDDATQRIEYVARNIRLSKKQKRGRRDVENHAGTGASFGGGQKEPCNLRLSKNQDRLITSILLSSFSFQCIAGFANSLFAAYAPLTYALYRESMNKLFDSDATLRRPFLKSVFAAVTFNLGPRTRTRPHTDQANLSFGWCAITALGNFDPDCGGHLILWDLGLMIRFPPGSTILIPSALLVHSNAPVSSHETRYSVVQYSAAGLFRWVHNGCQSDKTFKENATAEQLVNWEEERRERWVRCADKFSYWNDLCASHET